MNEKHQCSASVYRSHQFTGGTCQRNGIVFENGKWWCKQHSPSEQKRKEDELHAKWKAQDEQRAQARERIAAMKQLTAGIPTAALLEPGARASLLAAVKSMGYEVQDA